MIDVQFNLELLYQRGKGTEKILKKPFIGIKKQQKMDVLKHNLILHYYNV